MFYYHNSVNNNISNNFSLRMFSNNYYSGNRPKAETIGP
jgi:hypothetical protein